jgi:hypothetical protein
MPTVAAMRKPKSRPPPVDRAKPTAERLARAGPDIFTDDVQRQWLRDSPLERAFSRGVITPGQYNAALKYRHHWHHAGLSDPLSSVDLNRIFASDVSGFSGMSKTDNQYFHRQRYREAYRALSEVLADPGIVDRIVCREERLDDVGRRLGWRSKPQAIAAATQALRVALDRLRKLWGLA